MFDQLLLDLFLTAANMRNSSAINKKGCNIYAVCKLARYVSAKQIAIVVICAVILIILVAVVRVPAAQIARVNVVQCARRREAYAHVHILEAAYG